MYRQSLALALLLVGGQAVPAVPDSPVPATEEEIDAAIVEANEPRYVAPTTRDRIGRVWVPVQVDGKGPFRLVLDTGALNSALTEQTALKLGMPQGTGKRVLVRGSTGSAVTPAIAAATLTVGDLVLRTQLLPIVPHAFGGAEGLLGVEGMGNQRIEIDFRRDRIHIARSRNHRAAPGFSTVRFLPDPMNLLVVPVQIGKLRVRAIIDTGAHTSVGNLALQKLLQRRGDRERIGDTEIHGATGAVQIGTMSRLPQLRLGELVIQDMQATFADLYLFHTWQLGDQPALLIGMDVLGLVDSLVIDYRRHELHIKPRS
jgi:predicted aspartyl protease